MAHSPPRRLPPLNALKAFEAAARHGSLARAAAELGVTAGAVSQQIRQLEAILGVALFRRHARGVALTDAALAASPLLADAFERLREASEALAGGGDQNVVRVGAPGPFAVKWLAPRLARFAAQQGCETAVIADPEPAALERLQIDLEVRLAAGRRPGVEGRFLFAETVAPAAAPHLLTGAGAERARVALETAPLVHDVSLDQDPSRPSWSDWLAARGVVRADITRGDRYAASHQVVDAVVAGRGVGLVKRALAQGDIAAGRLEALFLGELTTLAWGYELVWPKGRALSASARAFADWIAEEAAPFEHSGV